MLLPLSDLARWGQSPESTRRRLLNLRPECTYNTLWIHEAISVVQEFIGQAQSVVIDIGIVSLN